MFVPGPGPQRRDILHIANFRTNIITSFSTPAPSELAFSRPRGRRARVTPACVCTQQQQELRVVKLCSDTARARSERQAATHACLVAAPHHPSMTLSLCSRRVRVCVCTRRVGGMCPKDILMINVSQTTEIRANLGTTRARLRIALAAAPTAAMAAKALCLPGS